MYSLTQTGIHWLHQPEQNQPLVKMQCRCNRSILQQQIYTCLACSSYCCHYCTVPQFSSYQCRACKRLSQSNLKSSKCTFCFSCPHCQNVLTLSKDPKSKCWIYVCQFCYWNSKQINMKEQRAQILQDNLFKLTNLKQAENRIYNTAHTFFKEINVAIQLENQSAKYTHTTSNRRSPTRSSSEESTIKDRKKIQRLNSGIDTIKHTSLEEDSEEYTSNEQKYPQALPLLTKKIRRCPECTKPLTNIYRPVMSNEPNIEPMHKQLKVIQCQRLPPVNGKVIIKFLKNCQVNEKHYKINDQDEIDVNKPYLITATIQNKRKNADVAYTIKIEPFDRKK